MQVTKLTKAEKILIETLREDKLLRKAIFRYFESLSGIELPPEYLEKSQKQRQKQR